MKKLKLVLTLLMLTNTLSSQIINYTPQINGIYVQENNGTPNYSELTISNENASSQPFSVIMKSCYNELNERICETTNTKVFIDGPDEDESFISIDGINEPHDAYPIWFEKHGDDIFCLIDYNFEEPVRYKLERTP